MKYLLILSTFLCSSQILFAQNYTPIQTGPRLTFDYVITKSPQAIAQGADGVDSVFVNADRGYSQFGLGMMMQFNIKDFLFFRPELIVHTAKSELSFETLPNGQIEKSLFRHYSYSLPLQFGYRVDEWNLQGGIIWHNHLRAIYKEGEKADFTYIRDGSHTSLTFGIGYQTKYMLVDLHYQTALGSADQTLDFSGTESVQTMRPNQISLRVGFILSGRD